MTIIEALSYIMVTINSSVNFVIYYFLGESFRKGTIPKMEFNIYLKDCWLDKPWKHFLASKA
jgi:hypothetical protein